MSSVFNLRGTIKKYLSYRGFGFIEVEGREDDVFFHVSNYPRSALPASGQEVEFKLVETPKGEEATEIQVVEKTSEIFKADEEEKEEKPKEAAEAERVEEEFDLDELSGVGPTYQKLLRAAGITSKEQLSKQDPEELYEKLMEANEEKEITKRPPTQANVEAWINLAQE